MDELIEALEAMNKAWDEEAQDETWVYALNEMSQAVWKHKVAPITAAIEAYRKFKAKKAVDDWNMTSADGVIVDVTRDDATVLRTRTRLNAFVSPDGITPVIMVEGISGWYLLDRVKRVPAITEEEEEALEYDRGSGWAACSVCEKPLREHPEDLDHPGYDGHPCLVKDCGGRLWKL